jgi:hypothetical protein
MSSLLIYGIVTAEAGSTLNLDGLAPGVRLIAEGSVAAVVADAPGDTEFRGLSREDAMRWLLLHQRTLEAIIAETTVLPVKFGTVAPDEAAVQRMLVLGSKNFAAHLQQFADRLEMDVIVEWALNEVFLEIAAEPGIAELRATVLESDDTDAKHRLGIAVKASLDARRAALSSAICEALRPGAVDIAANPLTEERSVINLAMLLTRQGLDALDALLDRLDADHAGKLKFRCVGPLPPLAFATVEVTFPTAEIVEAAWRTLQLGDTASVADIKSAYFRLARERHPDAMRDNAQSSEMDELTRAQKLLMACAKTSELALQLNGPGLVTVDIVQPGQPIESALPDQQEAAA